MAGAGPALRIGEQTVSVTKNGQFIFPLSFDDRIVVR
jgi:hypothetical protein